MSPRARLMCLLVLICGLAPAGAEPLVIEPAAASGSDPWPSYVQERHAINVDVARMHADEAWSAEPGTGQTLHFTTSEIAGEDDSAFTWRGRVSSEDGYSGTATFTVRGDRVRGRLSLGRERYQIVTDEAGQVWLNHMDPGKRPPTHPPGGTKKPERSTSDSSDSPLTAQSSMTAASHTTDDTGESPVVDVLLFYTPAAAEHSGYEDEADLRLAIQNAMDATNTGFLNSEVGGRVRLLGIKRWDFDESQTEGMEDALNAFTDSEEIRDLAERHSADLSALVADYEDFCGLAWLLQEYTDSWTENNYSVSSVLPQCLGGQTLAHELGHNMGLRHDPDNASDTGTCDNDCIENPHGHYEDFSFRTIMSTFNDCDGGASGCPLIDHFSNPNVEDPGTSTHKTGIEGQRDNAQVLNSSMDHVQRWREPPATLTEALRGGERAFSTSGDSVWVVQDEIQHNDAPATLSGPVFDQERSSLRMDTSADEALEVIFVARALEGEPESRLVLRADDETLETLKSLDTEWREYSVRVPGEAQRLEWVWQTEPGVSLASAGQALVAFSAAATDEVGDTTEDGDSDSDTSSSSGSDSGSGSSSGSGCLPGVSSSGPDPTLSVLVLASLAGLGRRRRNLEGVSP